MNLLAAAAIAYLLWDPGELFTASFQLSFLSVAAIGGFSKAAPILERACAPYARGLKAIANVNADPHLEPRVAQFRVELRLAAETVYWSPAFRCGLCSNCWPGHCEWCCSGLNWR